MKSVLILSTYPFKKPYHGGQHRLYNIALAYKRAGLSVVSVSIYDKSNYQNDEIGKHDINCTLEGYRPYIKFANPYFSDYFTGECAAASQEIIRSIIKIISKQNIILIHIEHPWLLKIAKFIQRSLINKSYLVFGTQNIEWQLKATFISNNNRLSSQIINSIKKLEADAAMTADATLAVSDADMTWFNRFAKKIILVPNGTNPIKKSAEQISSIQSELHSESWVVFIGSAHPPNRDGFLSFLGKTTGYIPPFSKLLIIGGVADLLKPILLSDLNYELNYNRCSFFSKVCDDFIDAAISGSKAIILPIETGGGSNLKTAQALISGKRIVATTTSFRSYDKYMNISGVNITDTSYKFKQLVRESFSSNVITKRSGNELLIIKKLLWINTTSRLKSYVESLINSSYK